ncbi:HNH endonuclease [Rhodococcus pyridinivorans]|uniref:HNH endonuclease n=1 Tax=Rhodococcus pyridinivorans TaxID=103816 RepID=UPI000895E7F5|nr:HNH endonuclease [Rhodococcus pyridinivorans]
MPSLTCQTDGCERPILGRKLCATHYSKWYRTQRKYTIVCLGCGETVKVPRNTSTTCSRECAATVANAASQLAQASNGTTTRLTQCEWCWELFAATSIKKFCSDTCANNSATERARLQRSPLRAAIEDGDHDTAIALIGARADRTERGCWEWPKVRDGYPYIRVGKRDIGLHRMVLEIKEGLPLGVQSAHHICANTKCVNPDHLQPVTHRDNTAEMLARRTYLDRIEELEGALMALDPNHPLLDRVRVA